MDFFMVKPSQLTESLNDSHTQNGKQHLALENQIYLPPTRVVSSFVYTRAKWRNLGFLFRPFEKSGSSLVVDI